jgi:hypothetical protein
MSKVHREDSGVCHYKIVPLAKSEFCRENRHKFA